MRIYELNNTERINEILKVFKALSDGTRLRIINLLSKTEKALCVCEIMDSLRITQYNASRHLKVLKLSGLVEEKREGRWVLYYIVRGRNDFFDSLLNLIKELPDEMFEDDLRLFNLRIALRERGKCVVGTQSQKWKRVLGQVKEDKKT